MHNIYIYTCHVIVAVLYLLPANSSLLPVLKYIIFIYISIFSIQIPSNEFLIYFLLVDYFWQR
jgi:hypothetical protein